MNDFAFRSMYICDHVWQSYEEKEVNDTYNSRNGIEEVHTDCFQSIDNYIRIQNHTA